MKTFVWFLFSVLIPFSLVSQTIIWEEQTSNYQFPQGMKLFKGTISGNDTFFAYYYEVDMTYPDIAVRPYLRTSPAQVDDFTAEVGAYAAINGGFFAGTTSVSSVIYPGQIPAINLTSVVRNSMTYPLIRPIIAMHTDRTMATEWVYHHSYNLDDLYIYENPLPYVCNAPSPLPAPVKANGIPYENIAFGLGGGPQLIKDGVITITYCEEIFWGSGVLLTDYRPRTAVGYKSDQKVILFATNNMRIGDMAEMLLGLGCYEAINLDGGGSTAISAGGQSLYDQNRAVPTIFAIVHSDSLNIPNQPTFEKIIDTSDEGVTFNGSWFPTANPGSWESPSLLHGLATNNEYYQFPLNLPAAGEYEIYGWWTSSANRSTNTPFIIDHANGQTQVPVNQTINGSTWALIGTYNFNGTADEKVRVTAGATTNAYVVADAIRILSYDPALNQNVIAIIQPVQDISVPFGTPLNEALALLSQQTTIVTTQNQTFTVDLNWTSQTYSANVPGDYQAVATFVLPEGVLQSDPPMPLEVLATITVEEATGLGSYALSKINIYPNPADGYFVIEGKSAEALRYEIFSNEGKIVANGSMTGNFSRKIDLSGQPSGIYMLRLSDSKTNRFYKIALK
jgi:hypothetical protein